MIPSFTDAGYLPTGVYPATLEEIQARFGQESEVRRAQMESIRWLVDLATRAGVSRIILNGSFVTDIIEPNDVDCVLLVESSFPSDPRLETELNDGLPFLEIKLAGQVDFDIYRTAIFASDRIGIRKGMIEIIL